MTDIPRAVRIAMNVHEGAVDKDGKPYILHPLRVMAHCGELGENYACAAVLHDVCEDGNIDVLTLSHAYEFNDDVVAAVDALTRRDAETYLDYLRRCRNNPIAKAVKVCDLQDDMRQSSDKRYKSRCERYEAALEFLNGGAE